MEIINLQIVFLVIIIILWMRKPLFVAILGGFIASVFLFKIPFLDTLKVIGQATISSDTLNVILSFYLVTILQKMLEQKNHLQKAQASFDILFRNRRVNAGMSSTILGLLPSAAVMSICAAMVDKTCGNYLNKKEKMSVACFYRHIPEMFLPTFSSVLLALTLSNVNAGSFVLAMIPMVLMAALLGDLFFLRKAPREMFPLDVLQNTSKREHLMLLLKNLWSLATIVFIIIAFDVSVCVATPIVIVADYIIDHFHTQDILPILKTAVEPLVLASMYLIMLFKGIITYTGVVNLLPDFFSQFPIPVALTFGLIFFFGSIISGSQAIIALCLPMAYTAIPNGGLPLLVMLMSFSWAAMQISPTHVCSFVAAKYFHTTLGDLIISLIPVCIVFCIVSYGYSILLKILF